MNTNAFIVKQHAKYYLKVMRRNVRDDTTDEASGLVSDGFWQYEQTPRAIS